MMVRRRNLLMTLLTAPFFATQSEQVKQLTGTSSIFNIFLHGLLFMEHDQDKKGNDLLVIKAPEIPGHLLWCGPHGNVTQCNAPEIDPPRKDLVPSIPGPDGPGCEIPGDVDVKIPQFSRKATKVGNLEGKRRHRIKLPWPKKFFSIRTDRLPKFITDNTQESGAMTVRDSLFRCSGSVFGRQLGLVTVLQYEVQNMPSALASSRSCAGKYHYYYQHDPSAGHTNINDHLKAAKSLFDSAHSNFDLKVDPSDICMYTQLQLTDLPDCVDSSDELAYLEIICLKELFATVAKEQRLLCENPQNQDQNSKEIAGAKQKLIDLLDTSCAALASSANCPNFYVGP
jgi:hypothetical protein